MSNPGTQELPEPKSFETICLNNSAFFTSVLEKEEEARAKKDDWITQKKIELLQ